MLKSDLILLVVKLDWLVNLYSVLISVWLFYNDVSASFN